MGSAKDDLRTTIEALSEGEAARAMEFIRARTAPAARLRGGRAQDPQATLLRGRRSREGALGLLALNPDIDVPPADAVRFDPVEPIHAEGMPASRLLIEDRR